MKLKVKVTLFLVYFSLSPNVYGGQISGKKTAGA
jgi:hypothetical protein